MSLEVYNNFSSVLIVAVVDNYGNYDNVMYPIIFSLLKGTFKWISLKKR